MSRFRTCVLSEILYQILKSYFYHVNIYIEILFAFKWEISIYRYPERKETDENIFHHTRVLFSILPSTFLLDSDTRNFYAHTSRPYTYSPVIILISNYTS